MYRTIFIGLMIIIISWLIVDYFPLNSLYNSTYKGDITGITVVDPTTYLLKRIHQNWYWIGSFLAGLYMGYNIKKRGWLYAGLTGTVAIMIGGFLTLLYVQLFGAEYTDGGFSKQLNLIFTTIYTVTYSLLVGIICLIGGVVGNTTSRTTLLIFLKKLF
jgi:hypothetical protein